MAKLSVHIDPSNEHVQIYGTYRFCTEVPGDGTLYKVSMRKHYPDVLARGRKETSILDAIENYKKEIDEEIQNIRNQYR